MDVDDCDDGDEVDDDDDDEEEDELDEDCGKLKADDLESFRITASCVLKKYNQFLK